MGFQIKIDTYSYFNSVSAKVSLEQVRRITLAGIRGYEGKIERRKKEGGNPYIEQQKKAEGKNKSPGGNIKGEDLKTRTVIYVEFTPRGGTLKKNEGALDETGGEPGI